jgi:hypothetical protein
MRWGRLSLRKWGIECLRYCVDTFLRVGGSVGISLGRLGRRFIVKIMGARFRRCDWVAFCWEISFILYILLYALVEHRHEKWALDIKRWLHVISRANFTSYFAIPLLLTFWGSQEKIRFRMLASCFLLCFELQFSMPGTNAFFAFVLCQDRMRQWWKEDFLYLDIVVSWLPVESFLFIHWDYILI